jgi:hypothetical protein
MASKKQINKLTVKQARVALLYLLEKTYSVSCGAIWNQQIDEAIKAVESSQIGGK